MERGSRVPCEARVADGAMKAYSWKRPETRKARPAPSTGCTPASTIGLKIVRRKRPWMRRFQRRPQKSAAEVLARLRKRCGRDHEHTRLEGGGRTAKAAEYPPELCLEILKGRLYYF